MIFALLLISVFLLGMISGAIVLVIIAFYMERRDKENGTKKKEGV